MNTFDYKEFKKEMNKRGHEVHKKGIYITIKPNNNYYGYSKGFVSMSDIISGYEEQLKLVSADHYNTWVYESKFKIIAE